MPFSSKGEIDVHEYFFRRKGLKMTTNCVSPNRRISRLEHEARLFELASKLEPNSIAILVSNPEAKRTGDAEFAYRQSSDILYVNGFPEPNSALVITRLPGQSLPELIMFVQPKDPTEEVWTGIRIGVKGAIRSYGANQAYPIGDFKNELRKLLAKCDQVYYKFGINPELDATFTELWQPLQMPVLNPEFIVHEMRLFKSDEELELLQRAADISAAAHCRAMLNCRPGLCEFQIQAMLEDTFTENGASAPAYNSIVAGGNHACVLHYTSNRDKLADGDLILIDAAAEFAGYASDITRTFPVNGKFTEPQREIYELVLKAQLAAIAAAKPGSSIRRVHLTAERVLRAGLVELGILSKEQGSAAATRRMESLLKMAKEAKKGGTKPSVDPAKERATVQTFFPHGTSHWMGLDVHDVGTRETRTDLGKKRPLEPGMVFTVEPGLYFEKDDIRVPARYRGIGVRIEDDLVVTTDGCTILTAAVPKTVREIESLMATGAARR